MQRTNPSRLQTGLRRLRLDWVLYALLLPTLVYFVIFRVIPIWNMRLAFLKGSATCMTRSTRGLASMRAGSM